MGAPEHWDSDMDTKGLGAPACYWQRSWASTLVCLISKKQHPGLELSFPLDFQGSHRSLSHVVLLPCISLHPDISGLGQKPGVCARGGFLPRGLWFGHQRLYSLCSQLL